MSDPDTAPSLDGMVPLVYRELRAIAHQRLAAHGGVGTLDTGALVHEAYLKVAANERSKWRSRSHFFALTSRAMRQILTDHARARGALKRGGERRPITLDEELLSDNEQVDAMLELDEALTRLGEIAPRLVQVVECRFFGDMSDDEIAEALGVEDAGAAHRCGTRRATRRAAGGALPDDGR